LLELLAVLPCLPAPPYTPCVKSRQHTAPHSSFPPTTALLQIVHMDVWGPAPILEPRQDCYFLILVDDYSRYTTVPPLRQNASVPRAVAASGYANLPSLAEVACSSTTLPCLAVPSGFLMDLDIPSFSRNLVGVGYLKDHGITVTFPVHGRTAIFTNTSNRALLATSTNLCTTMPATLVKVPLAPHPPFFLAPNPPPAPDPLVHQPLPGPASSSVFHATPLPSLTRQVPPPSPQSSSQSLQQPSALPQQVAVESGDVGAGAEGTSTGGASSEGIGVGGTCTRGASSGGVGVRGTQWQLRRPDNGLHQAPREWHDTLRTTVAALDFFPSSADLSMFVRRGSTPLFVLVCVDDLVFATPDRHALASVKEELQRRHTCTDLGEVQRYLGLQITRDKAARTITPTQSYMVEQTLTRFRFPFSKVQFPLLAVDHGLTDPPSDEPFESSGSYPELVGCLVYLMTYTRPDLVFPLSVLARFVAPGRHRPSHWLVAKRVAKYVASTSGMGLVLGGKQPVTLIGFSDSSWAHDAEMLRTTQGYCFSLGTGAVSWRSTRASSVSGSSCEAEVYATAVAAQDLCWPSFLLTDLGERPCSPQVLFADNRSAILLCEEPRLVGKAKHIQLRYFLLHELQQRGQALVRHVVSKANTADIFTKALSPCDHQRLCTQLGLVSTCPHLLA
ncbi:unnamed protein product, partial [Closterium sp. NIES-54]